MLQEPQLLNPKIAEKLRLDNDHKLDMADKQILSQRIGTMLDDLSTKGRKSKPGLKTRIRWRLHSVRDCIYSIRHTVRNHRKWHKTMRGLRPWEGFDGLISVMLTHLRDYVENEEKYGDASPEYKAHKIASAKETVGLLERMKEPEGYADRLLGKVGAKYPAYQSLITKCKYGTSSSGDFVAQGSGWAGVESGKDPRKGYFEFVDGRFELVPSPNQMETDQLLEEIRQYHEDLTAAYRQATVDSDKDFERLAKLLQENLYTWWD